MTKIELKEALMSKVTEIEDENLLQSILNVIELEQEETKIIFTEAQMSEIEIARESVRENGIHNEEVFKKTKEWLKE